MEFESSLIVPFLKRNKRERYTQVLASPRWRSKFISQLAHFSDFDPQLRIPIPSNKLFAANSAIELLKRNAPGKVYAISENRSLDQRELPLMEALQAIIGQGMGTFLSCIPGRLAFMETETERFILERHELPEKSSYIRFVIGQRDEDSHVEQGIFQAVAGAVNAGAIRGRDATDLNELRAWFSDNLQRPNSFGRGKLPLGICWFKTAATEHMSRIWAMAKILERNGIYVKKIKTDRPGYLVYEDDWQVVAEPFRTGTMPGT